MIRKKLRETPIRLALIVALLAVLAGGCALHAPSSLSTPGAYNWQAARVVKNLDVLMTAVIDANNQTPPLISEKMTRKIVVYCRSAAATAESGAAGWRAGLLAGLAELSADLSVHERTLIGPYLALVATVVREVQ